jgi:hypothetical protein
VIGLDTTTRQARRVADAATTGTLVVIAVSGGAGAFLGAALGQAVQLHRDRKQYEREDARHERERQQALDDARLQRREDRYVALLSEVSQLDRTLDGLCILLPDLAEQRDRADDPKESEDWMAALAESVARSAQHQMKEAERQHRDLSDAFLAAHGVASPAVRTQGVLVTDWPMAVTSVHVGMLTLHNFRQHVIFEDAGSREVSRAKYAEHLVEEIQNLRGVMAELDRLLRAELALD